MADFIAGYISGAASILLGSPLDIIKARLQTTSSNAHTYRFPTARSLLAGTAPPVLTYGALNAILFGAYNRSLSQFRDPTDLSAIFVAGALGGLATFPLSAPTEVLKLRAQLSRRHSSWEVARRLVRTHGARGLYIGGGVTAVRDAVGYGFYFAAYEGVKRLFPRPDGHAAILVAGGVAGCVTWASVYPLDVVKTRVQTQIEGKGKMATAAAAWHGGLGSWDCARSAWREGGVKVFFDGLGVCMARAFLVNAVQWAIYEYVMRQIREFTPKEEAHHAPLIRREEAE